jgi:gluconolactonase
MNALSIASAWFGTAGSLLYLPPNFRGRAGVGAGCRQIRERTHRAPILTFPVKEGSNSWTRLAVSFLTALLIGAFVSSPANAEDRLFSNKPEAIIDLGTSDGVALVQAKWRYSDTNIVEADFFAPGPEGQPTGKMIKTLDIAPRAGGKDFDDSKWEAFDGPDIMKRRTTGKFAFNWYRIGLTIPEHIGDYNPKGSTVVFDTRVDDYAEIWVDGELIRGQGQSGGSVVRGWNADNRLVIARNVKPGQKIQLAIFGINGPLSAPPTNFIWLHHARLEFHQGPTGPMAIEPAEVNVEVVRLDPAINEIVSNNPKIFKLAEGFTFTEGPIWVPSSNPGGYLLFSDPNENTIWKYDASRELSGRLSEFRKPSGYAGTDIGEYGQPGSNGLTLDEDGRLTINEHGNHRVSRIEKDGSVTVLADNFQGKRLNSPNDLVYKSDGAVYFTDPPFGLPRFFDDPRKELPYSGIYRWKDSKVTLLAQELTGPNGIAFSPDEKYLYIGNWDEKNKVVMRYPVKADGTLDKGEVFFDMTSAPGEDALDGVKVDVEGNLYVSGPGGLWILSPQGKHLGTIKGPKHPHNMAWGDADGKTLYMTAQSALYKMRLNIAGVRPQPNN